MKKVITDEIMFSHVVVSGGSLQSVCLWIPKEDHGSIRRIREAIAGAAEEGAVSKWSGEDPGLGIPLRDGGEMLFINALGCDDVSIVGPDLLPVPLDRLCSGSWGKASISFYPYRTKDGHCGVGAGVNNIQVFNKIIF